MFDLPDRIRDLMTPIRGRRLTQQEIDDFDAAIDYLHKAIAPCRAFPLTADEMCDYDLEKQTRPYT
jgi:hypothetical protein